MERYKLLIFDFDGTIGDTRQNIILTFQMTMRELGLQVRSEESCASTIGLTLQDAFNVLYPDMQEEDYTRLTDTYRRIFRDNRKILVPGLFPGVMETLEELKKRGYVMSIASSRLSPSLISFLEDMKIDKFFCHVVGGDNVIHPKPAPDAVADTMKHLGYSASETLVIGDMPFDIMMARNAGVKSCGVTYGNSNAAELEQSGADYIFDKFGQLLDILS